MIDKRRMKEKLRAYLVVTRPQFWIRSAGPVAAGYLLVTIRTPMAALILAMLATVVGTASCKTLNDYFDRDIDSIDADKTVRGVSFAGGSGVIQKGLLKPAEALVFGLALAVVAIATSFMVNFVFSAFLICEIAIGVMYSAPPLRLKNRGMFGGILRSLTYCLLAFNSGWAAASAGVNMFPLILGALLTSAFFGFDEVGNLIDYDSDLKHGIMTFPIQVGKRMAAKILSVCQFIPFGVIALFALVGRTKADPFVFIPLSGVVVLLAIKTTNLDDIKHATAIRLGGSIVEALSFFIFI